MNLKKNLLFLIFYLVLSGQVLASEKILAVGICGKKPDMDSILSCKTRAEKILAGTVFNSLFKYSPGSPNSIEAELAESIPKPRMLNSRQYWTVTIKKNVKFHRLSGGQDYELEAEDVAFSLELLAGSDDSRLLSGIEIRKESRYEITLILDKPLSPDFFLPMLTGYNGVYIFSRKIFEGKGMFSGTGPFMVASGIGEDSLYLRVNKSYFKGMPVIDSVRFVFGPDISKMEHSLSEGYLDVLIPADDFSDKIDDKGNDNFKRLYFRNGWLIYLGFNIEAGPFNDKGLRKITAENIDRDAFCSNIDGCESLYGLCPLITTAGLTRDEIIRLGLDYGLSDSSRKALPVNTGEQVVLCVKSREIPDEIIHKLRDILKKMGFNLSADDPEDVITTCRDDACDLKLLSFETTGSIQKLLGILMTENGIDKKYKYLVEASERITSNARQTDLLKHIQIKILADIDILPLVFIREYAVLKKDIDLGYDCTSQPFFIVMEKTRIANSGNQ
ncbi:MAG TPA: ABC transporter substrate-binding protein [Desulfomonilia bacterium]